VGSFNNHWGVPFTILAEPEGTEISVVEMGMNHEGELATLAQIADVDVAVCTYVGVEHIEYFGNLEKIAAAEEEIYEFSPKKAQRIYNIDNIYTLKMYEKAKNKFTNSKTWTFSEKNIQADVCLQIDSISMSQMTLSGKIGQTRSQAKIQVFGAHNITNVMVAATVALACGLQEDQIWAALPRLKTNWGRNQLVQTSVGAEILFDAYNANPDSVKALIDNMKLIQARGKVIGIFGEMKELGELSAKMHEEVGEYIGRANFDAILFVGEHYQEFKKGLAKANTRAKTQVHANFEEKFATGLASELKSGDIVLVKGSRGMQLERFVLACQPLDFKTK
jgi:UDP-N-acetylmuramoyl-tripeptide--D-alanyl-D-alanine ligase